MENSAHLIIEESWKRIDEILQLLDEEIKRRGDHPECWRLKVARSTLTQIRSEIARPDLSMQEIYWRIAGNIRGIFGGWTDAPPEFIIPHHIHMKLYPLYKEALALSGHV